MIKGEALVPRLELAADRLMWIDSHCHVTADAFAEDRAAVLERAARGGRRAHDRDRRRLRRRAQRRRRRARRAPSPRVYAAVGVHPHDAAELDDAGRAQRAQPGSRPRAWWRSASAGSTTGTSTRRARCSATCFAWHVALARELRLPGRRSTCATAAATPTRSCSTSGRRGARRGRGRAALLHARRRLREARARAASRDLLLRHPHLQARPRPARDRPRRCRSSGCWSRPTRRCSRPRASAAGATSRRTSPRSARCWPRRRAGPSKRSRRRHRRATRAACSGCRTAARASADAGARALALRLAREAGAIQRERYESRLRDRHQEPPRSTS